MGAPLADDDRVTSGGTLDPERFARVRAIFEAALGQPAPARPAFVAGACVGDPVLLAEVEAMLAADAAADGLLDAPGPRGPGLRDSTPSGSTPEEGRFPAGTVLAGRYRVLGLLGRGGMGEVYRAHDLILNQAVALKFLNPTNLSDATLARFRNEVRIARQVSHPNVCRVYDLGMVDGLHFLSMEYIDGEDLASLLRRIGRLPQDKAIEFTRKICAGLGAAHERGVLHRDLKPANIMIDGRGQPRITDFGLAGLAAEIPLSDLRSGTPAYMSPEQKAGKDVTTRSDIYALGLVLHEMFTGKRRSDAHSNPSDLVKDLDPTIERLIFRCLDEDPKRRPATGLNVAMALPGGDPIAAALAAGETPSPEMVAASQEKEGLSATQAWLCFALVIAVLGLAGIWRGNQLIRLVPLPSSPDVLVYKAQQILRQLGYPDPPAHAAFSFSCCDRDYLNFIAKRGSAERNAVLATGHPAAIGFWYRQHRTRFPIALVNFGLSRITYDQPANVEPGMIRMDVDTLGRLVSLEVRPDSIGTRPPSANPDTATLFAVAGLDPARFTPTTPRQPPLMTNDAILAWTGTYGDGRPERVTVEAAFWEGRPVLFSTRGDWPKVRNLETSHFEAIANLIGVVVLLMTLIGAPTFAWRNTRSGRGDRRGAFRIMAIMFLLSAATSLLVVPHQAARVEIAILLSVVLQAGAAAALVGCLYLAVEPHVRRNWPDALISSSRVLAGHIRNSLVASHVLVGMTVKLAIAATILGLLASDPRAPLLVEVLNGMRGSVSVIFMMVAEALGYLIAFTLTVVILRLLLQVLWVADLLAALLFSFVLTTGAVTEAVEIQTRVYFVVHALGMLWLLRRFGLLAVFAGLASEFLLVTAPVVYGTWYTGDALLSLGLVALVAAWALWVILTERRSTPEVPA